MVEGREELTAKMHSEFKIDKETEIKHKAWTVWEIVGDNPTEDTLKKYCRIYRISVKTALKYKASWFD